MKRATLYFSVQFWSILATLGFSVHCSAQTNSIDWRYGRPGVRVVTNAVTEAQVNEIVGNAVDPFAAKTNLWDAAFGWGDHAGLYRDILWVPTWADVTDKPTTFPPSTHTHTYTDITDPPWLTAYTETDPVFAAWLATNPLNGFLTEEQDTAALIAVAAVAADVSVLQTARVDKVWSSTSITNYMDGDGIMYEIAPVIEYVSPTWTGEQDLLLSTEPGSPNEIQLRFRNSYSYGNYGAWGLTSMDRTIIDGDMFVFNEQPLGNEQFNSFNYAFGGWAGLDEPLIDSYGYQTADIAAIDLFFSSSPNTIINEYGVGGFVGSTFVASDGNLWTLSVYGEYQTTGYTTNIIDRTVTTNGTVIIIGSAADTSGSTTQLTARAGSETITMPFVGQDYVDTAVAAQYSAWTTNVIAASGTNIITEAWGNQPRLELNGNAVIDFDFGASSSGLHRLTLSLWSGTNSVAWMTNNVDFAEAPELSTNAYNTILIRKTGTSKAEGRQL